MGGGISADRASHTWTDGTWWNMRNFKAISSKSVHSIGQAYHCHPGVGDSLRRYVLANAREQVHLSASFDERPQS